MAAFARCNGTAITGEAAPFIVRLEVYVDGVLVGSVDHAAPPVGGDWYTWSIPIGEVAADADIVVIDYAAGGPGATGSVVPLDGRTNCATPTPTTTTTTVASTSTSVTTTTLAPPADPATTTTRPPLPILIVTIPDEATTTTIAEPVGCCADHVDTTVATTTTVGGTPNTLPATGANATPLIGGGVIALTLGFAALVTSRRRPA